MKQNMSPKDFDQNQKTKIPLDGRTIVNCLIFARVTEA